MNEECILLSVDSLPVVELPQYYKEGYFAKDSLLHPELQGGRYGVAGTPVPLSLRGDNIITLMLLVSFVLAMVSFSNAREFILRQAKSFLYGYHDRLTGVTETATELRLQLLLVTLTSFFFALLFYFYYLSYKGETLAVDSPYYLIAILWATTVAYFALKALLYTVVNKVFFGSKRNVQWLKSLLFITSLEGVMLFPAVILRTYFDMNMQNVVIYFVVVLVIVKLLVIYRCFVIFFRRNVFKLQIILYFCTLEVIPLLTLWGAVEILGNVLIINF